MLKLIGESSIENKTNYEMGDLSIVLIKLLRILKERLLVWKINKCYLMQKVIKTRDLAMNKITAVMKSYASLQNMKRYHLLTAILSMRASACEKIQTNYRSHYYQKQVYELLSKVKDCFTIIPSVGAEGDKILMRIYLNGKTECVKLHYCKLRRLNLIDIPRTKALHINGRKLKFNFIVNKQVVIDSSFTTLNENDIYCNIIDFDLIEKRRISTQKIYSDVSSNLFSRQSSSSDSRTTNDDEDEYLYVRLKGSNHHLIDDEMIDDKERTFYSSNRNLKHYSATYTIPKASFDRKLIMPRKKMTITSDISFLKSILKPFMSSSSSGRCLNAKKVCFGKVQFSF